jgi:tetratricopeptide (TPR) repeat protein
MATCHSGALVSKIERGDRVASLEFCASADAVLDTGGSLERMWAAGASDPARARRAGIDAAVTRLRLALGMIGIGDDHLPLTGLDRLSRQVGQVNNYRLQARYSDLGDAVPGLLAALSNAELRSVDEQEHQRVAVLMALTLRAADGLAFKLGHHDLSARLIDLMAARAQTSEDPATIATAAYVASETYFVTGDLSTAHRALCAAIDRAVSDDSTPTRAAVGALHMRAAVVCARLGHAVTAAEHLEAARQAAELTPEGIYRGTAFGPDSLRIHELAVATELRDASAIERAARWRPRTSLPAERRSHYFIELGRAQFDLGRYDDSRDCLRMARQIAPQHTREHPQVRRVETALGKIGRRRRPTDNTAR